MGQESATSDPTSDAGLEAEDSPAWNAVMEAHEFVKQIYHSSEENPISIKEYPSGAIVLGVRSPTNGYFAFATYYSSKRLSLKFGCNRLQTEDEAVEVTVFVERERGAVCDWQSYHRFDFGVPVDCAPDGFRSEEVCGLFRRTFEQAMKGEITSETEELSQDFVKMILSKPPYERNQGN